MSVKKQATYVFLFLFLLLCLTPSLGMLIFGSSKPAANELRTPKPAFTEEDGSFNLDYFSQLSDYLCPRLFLRQEAITLRNLLSVKLFATSPTEKVSLGRGDWLFYSETLHDDPLSERELWCAGENLRLMQEYTESSGKRFLFVLCPNKASVCPASLVNENSFSDGLNLENKLDELGVSYSSLFYTLYDREDFFYHSDSHWNGLGAAAAADVILAALDRPSHYGEGSFTPGEGHSGDLSAMLFPASPQVEQDWLYPFTFRYTSHFQSPSDPTITTESDGSGSLFCYRDSFGNDLHPYLAESFATAVFSRKADYDLMQPEAELLLIELVERNIDYLYRYNHTYPAPERELTFDTEAAPPVEASVSEAGTLIRISGSLNVFDDAPLYLLTGDKLYECAPKPTGFTLCLPDFNGEAKLIYQQNGLFYAAPLHIK